MVAVGCQRGGQEGQQGLGPHQELRAGGGDAVGQLGGNRPPGIGKEISDTPQDNFVVLWRSISKWYLYFFVGGIWVLVGEYLK